MKRTGSCIFLWIFFSLLFSCKKKTGPEPVGDQREFYPWTRFVMGADLSYVNAVENAGGSYKDSGKTKDPFILFKERGTNMVRVRLWHNPSWQASLNSGRVYSDLTDVTRAIRRAKNAGMAVCLDLHYSDTWADPANQSTPAAWSGLSLDLLKDSVYQYTLSVLNHFKGQGLTPEMVQIGNETNSGILFPTGRVTSNNFTGFATLLNSGIKAVRDFSAGSSIKPPIILHVAKPENASWWSGNVYAAGVTDFDYIGISWYYIWSNIHSLAALGNQITSIRHNLGKKVMIVETAYPWTSASADNYTNIISGASGFGTYPVSPEGQLQLMKDLVQQVIRSGGSGVFYWEPAWITSGLRDNWGTGSSWENNAFFDFYRNALPVFDYMTWKYSF